jgi:hypothetical protein
MTKTKRSNVQWSTKHYTKTKLRNTASIISQLLTWGWMRRCQDCCICIGFQKQVFLNDNIEKNVHNHRFVHHILAGNIDNSIHVANTVNCTRLYDFRIKTMFGSPLSSVVYRRIHVLFTLFVFIWVYCCPIHIALCFCFVCLRFVSRVPNVASFSWLSIYKQLEIKTNHSSFFCGNRNRHHNMELQT